MKLESFVAASKAAKSSVAKGLALFVIALALIVPGYNAANAQDEVVAKFSGAGASNTRPFTVTGPWEVQYNNMGNFLSIIVKDANGQFVSLVGNTTKQGKGASYQPKAGTFFLNVNGDQWTVTVVRVK